MGSRPAAWIAAVALSGVTAGHMVSYYLAVPNTRARNLLLAQTGHSYSTIAVPVAAVLELAGVLGMALRHFRAGRTGARPVGLSFGRLAGHLAAIQLVGFTTLEVFERATSGTPVGSMFRDHLYTVGLLTQFVVACGAALLLLAVSRTAASIGATLARAPAVRRPCPAVRSPELLARPLGTPRPSSIRGRAPPAVRPAPACVSAGA